MRVLFAATVIALGLAGDSAASAADLPSARLDYGTAYTTRFAAVGQRAEQFVIYDDQPGVLVRAYWLAPWRHRHYFPATGRRPRIGRLENLAAVSRPSKPPQTFLRSWSNAWAYEHELPRAEKYPQPRERAKP